ncbi:MAG: D-alanine--D-alanine ligase [Tepidisphaeraceae bacterium]|jgi:D-alanine-D-alanine ligase
MRVTVLLGGPSAEREVSLRSGKAVADGLRSMGHEVFESDIAPAKLAGLDHPADVVFPVLHGQFGESGELQDILESRGLAFVGAGSKASRLGINKAATKKAWEKAGLPTPKYEVLTANGAPRPTLPALSAPCVVKALDSGSSIDVYLCKTDEDARKAVADVLKKHGRVLVEQFIKGPELTVGLLEEQPLAPMRIVPTREFFDYQAKYSDATTEHRFDTGLPADVNEACRELAREANAAVGAIDLARIDMMIDGQNRPYLLEINTLPGFTSVSLLPEAARHAGIEFGPLVDRLVKRAFARGPRRG